MAPTALRKLLITVGLALGVGITPFQSAHAVKNYVVVLRAAGSGAVLGLGAGLLSYPFAKSTGTLVAGAIVGALLGTAYGFYLVDQRPTTVPVTWIPNRRDEWLEVSEKTRSSILPSSTAREMNVVALDFPIYQF